MLDAPVNILHIVIPAFSNESEYRYFIELADDKEKLEETLIDYEKGVGKLLETITGNGCVIHRDRIVLFDMVKWLKENNKNNIGGSRCLYYAYLSKLKYSNPHLTSR